MSRFLGAIALIVFIPLSVVFLHAQAETADLSINATPSDAEPGAQVVLEAVSYGADLDQSLMSWTYNGKVVASGIGRRTITVLAPAAGSTGVITVSATGSGFIPTTASIVLRPASVDTLWEAADATVPPFYKGKALVATGGLVRVTAIPSVVAPRQLSFSWSRNNSALPSVSGYGKSSILFKQNSLVGTEKIGVDIKGGVFAGSGRVSVAPQPTTVIAYKNNDGFVDYTNGYTDTVPLRESGAILHFEPYYFSLSQDISTDLDIAMTSGGTPVENNGNPLEIGVSRPDNGGQNALELAITTVAYSLQHVEKTFSILFD